MKGLQLIGYGDPRQVAKLVDVPSLGAPAMRWDAQSCAVHKRSLHLRLSSTLGSKRSMLSSALPEQLSCINAVMSSFRP